MEKVVIALENRIKYINELIELRNNKTEFYSLPTDEEYIKELKQEIEDINKSIKMITNFW